MPPAVGRLRRVGSRAAVLLALLALSALRSAATQEAVRIPAARVLVLQGANLVDVQSGRVAPDTTLVIEGATIRELSIGTDLRVPGARVLDLKGRFVLPGLIDAHVHIRDADAARRALRSGVTTARSMGVDHFADAGLSALAGAGVIDGPELLAAGYHVQPRPSPALFIDMPQFADLLEPGLRGTDAMRRIANSLADRGASWIKVNATARAGLASADPREPFFEPEELRALTDEAGRAGIPVAAHAHGDEGGRAAVNAGVRSIEHGTYLSAATLALMADKGIYLVPTIAVVANMARTRSPGEDATLQLRGQHMLPRIRQTVSAADRLGVTIVAGTDSDYGAASGLRMAEEMEEIAAAGLSTREVLQAATTLAARLLNIDDRTGTLASGMEADLLVVEGNPLKELATIRDPLMVISNGRIVLDQTEWSTRPRAGAAEGGPQPPDE